MFIESYLFFEGRCDEAIAFYGEVVGAKVGALMRYRENPEGGEQCGPAPECGDKVMHATLRIGDTTVMLSDGLCTGTPNFQGFALTLVLQDEVEAARIFNAFAEGGVIKMPLGRTFWSPCFGMVADKFGITWMIMVVSES